MTRKKNQIVAQAKDRPCTDCGGIFHYSVMEFDHLPQYKKLFQLSQWEGWTKKEIKAEIAKCEVVCANCHRMRTWRRNHESDVQ